MSFDGQGSNDTQRRKNILNVVKVLSDIHNSSQSAGKADPVGIETPHRKDDTKPLDLLTHLSKLAINSSLATNKMLLESILRTSDQGLAPLQNASPEAIYSALQDRFGALEEKLQNHAKFVDRIISKNEADAKDPEPKSNRGLVQQTIYLTCPRKGRTAGRVKCLSQYADLSGIEVRRGPVTTSGGEPLRGAVVETQSTGFAGDQGSECVIKIEVDLRNCEIRGNDAETWIELHAPGHAALRIWVEIDVNE